MLDTISWMFSLQTQVGWLQVHGNQYFVTSAEFVFDKPAEDFGDGQLRDRVLHQIKDYLQDAHNSFDVPVMTKGTAFQQKVWTQLESIPVGQTWTYGKLAKSIGSSPRAVGGACRRNPVALIVPCHRVVAAQDNGGYAGATSGTKMQVKDWLLKHEAN